MEGHTGIGLVGSLETPAAGIRRDPGGIGRGEEEGKDHGRAGAVVRRGEEARGGEAELDGGGTEEEDGYVNRGRGPGHPGRSQPSFQAELKECRRKSPVEIVGVIARERGQLTCLG